MLARLGYLYYKKCLDWSYVLPHPTLDCHDLYSEYSKMQLVQQQGSKLVHLEEGLGKLGKYYSGSLDKNC